MFQPYSICKDHLKAIWGGGVTYCKSGFFRSRNQRIARLVPFHTERKLGVSLKFNSYGTQLISPKTVGHFFFFNKTTSKFEMFGHKATVCAEREINLWWKWPQVPSLCQGAITHESIHTLSLSSTRNMLEWEFILSHDFCNMLCSTRRNAEMGLKMVY